ncbi:putative transferase CAF17 homolog, mitochondrial [Hoplias malabaricus]|uniref:putative transferase CAF17 homolog, mitochondrial n=1 Tax=Hoplias malabaricus TaxID=27720 RepID=UPI00346229F9
MRGAVVMRAGSLGGLSRKVATLRGIRSSRDPVNSTRLECSCPPLQITEAPRRWISSNTFCGRTQNLTRLQTPGSPLRWMCSTSSRIVNVGLENTIRLKSTSDGLQLSGAPLSWISSSSWSSSSRVSQISGDQRRWMSTSSSSGLRGFRLSSRALLHIQGPDTHSFLQGIITNDINLLQEEHLALYSHLLNVQGRTLYDIIIYSLKDTSEDQSGVLLECDSSVLDSMTRHLKAYKIRRKISLSPRVDLSLWALLPCGQNQAGPEPLGPAHAALLLVRDPRTELMGWRVITRELQNPAELFKGYELGDTDQYHTHRYSIGVSEGVADLPPGEALPLESNLVFLNGISFSKGCYIGQELTARTHHTGVVRKRLMPLALSCSAQDLSPGGALESASGKPAGKYRTGLGGLGLGLVRLAHVKETLTIKTNTQTNTETVTAQASVPDWWPQDSKQ